MEGEPKPNNPEQEEKVWREKYKAQYREDVEKEYYQRKKNDANPHPGGEFDEQMRAQARKNKEKTEEGSKGKEKRKRGPRKEKSNKKDKKKGDKNEEKPEFTPEEIEEIKKQAYFIWEHRMSNDPERQKQKAKEYGLNENDLTGAVVDQMLKQNGIAPGSSEAEEFMRKWDWAQAENIFRRQKAKAREDAQKAKEEGEKSQAGDADSQKTASESKMGGAYSAEDAEKRDRAAEARSADFEAPGDAASAGSEPPQETIGEKLERLKNDLEEKRLAYARLDVDMSGKWAKIGRILGISIEEKKDPGVQAAEEAYHEALWKYIEAEKESMPAGNKDLARTLLKQVYLGEAVTLKSLKEDVRVQNNKDKDKFSLVDYYKKAVDGWKKMSFGKKLAVSGGMFAAGLLGGDIAAIFGICFAGRVVIRALGAGAMYSGAKRWQENLDMDETEYMVNQKINQLLDQTDWENRIRNLEKSHIETSVKESKSKMETQDLSHKRKAFYLASILPVVGTVFDAYRNFWTKGKSIEWSRSSSIEEAAKRPDVGAKVPDVLGEKPDVPGPEVKPPVVLENKLESAQDGPSSSGVPKKEIAEPEAPKVPEEKPAAPEIPPVSKTTELGADTIKKGGSLWRSTEKLIRANPEKYGLDPESKTFVRDARRATKDILDRYAEKQGVSYEELDKIARKKVQPGDILKLVKDPSTGKPEIEYSGKAVFNPDAVPKNISSAVPDQEQVAPRGSTVSERTGARMKKPEWLQAHDDNIAMKKGVEQYFSDVQKGTAADLRQAQEALAENTRTEDILRQGVDARGRLESVVQKAGIGNNVSVWGEPASKWFNEFVNGEQLVSQDVLQNDAVEDINKNRKILEKIFSQLPKPQPGQSTWEAFLDALRNNPDNLEKINRALRER
jgi:hypothetical protein